MLYKIDHNKIVSLILLLILINVASFSQIITVKQDGTGNYLTIQEAVDHSSDGDTVLVWPGEYIENVDKSKDRDVFKKLFY